MKSISSTNKRLMSDNKKKCYVQFAEPHARLCHVHFTLICSASSSGRKPYVFYLSLIKLSRQLFLLPFQKLAFTFPNQITINSEQRITSKVKNSTYLASKSVQIRNVIQKRFIRFLTITALCLLLSYNCP